MIDIKFLRENPEIVKENIRKKFQDEKLPLVDEAIRLDAEKRKAQMESEQLKAARNKLSKANGPLFGQLKKCEDEAKKAEIQAQIDANNAAVKADDERRAQLEAAQTEAAAKLQEIMYVIPNIIDPSVPIATTSRLSGSANRSCPILRCRTTSTSWRRLTALTRTPRAAWPAWVSTICWATSRGCTRLCWPMRAIL